MHYITRRFQPMNYCIFIGRLTAEPEAKFLSDGRVVTKFRIAVNRNYSKEKRTDFFQCSIWGKSGELFSKSVHKGQRVAIVGSVYNNEYEKDGEKHHSVEINVDRFEYLTAKNITDGEPIDE